MRQRGKTLVPGARIELARCCHRRILSPLRLPVPPSRHFLAGLPIHKKAFYLAADFLSSKIFDFAKNLANSSRKAYAKLR